jgi:hypothetical protein
MGFQKQIIPLALMIKESLAAMVKYVEFRTALVNTEIGEAYTWIELRNQVEQNLATKKLFDEWDKENTLNLIHPYLYQLENHETCSYLEALETVFEETRDNDTVIVVEDTCVQKVILALIEYLCQNHSNIKK